MRLEIGVADHFRTSRIFVFASIAGSVFNACFAWATDGLLIDAIFRFLVGVSLAGIYPTGMKMIVSWGAGRAGHALARLVAMLTLGTALPHGAISAICGNLIRSGRHLAPVARPGARAAGLRHRVSPDVVPGGGKSRRGLNHNADIQWQQSISYCACIPAARMTSSHFLRSFLMSLSIS